jgi:uncharacterized membrane protein YhfC
MSNLGPPDALFLLSGAGMLAVAAAAVIALRRRASWVFFGMGALAWTVGVALKVAWAVPLNKPILAAFAKHLGPASGPVSWLYIGLLTGVFEVGATWVFARSARLRRASGDEALAFGVGFGAIEALLLGLVSLAAVAVAILFWSRLPSAAREALGSHGTRWIVFLPILERAYTIIAHALSCVLVVEGVQRRKPGLIAVSFAYKTLLDGIAAWGIMAWNVRSNMSHFVWFELGMTAFVLASLVLLRLDTSARVTGWRIAW